MQRELGLLKGVWV